MFGRHPISPKVLTLKLPPSSLPQASYAKELINVPLKHGNNLTESKQILKELSENTMTSILEISMCLKEREFLWERFGQITHTK